MGILRVWCGVSGACLVRASLVLCEAHVR